MSAFLIVRLPSHPMSLKAVEFMQKNGFFFRISSNSTFLNQLLSSEGVEERFETAELKPGDEEKQLIQRFAVTEVREKVISDVKQDGFEAREEGYSHRTKVSVSQPQNTPICRSKIKSEEESDVGGSYVSPLNAADLLDSDEYKPFHTSVGQLLFTCPFTNCSSSYEMFEELEEHMKIHPDTQYFICDVCETSFFSKDDAIAHVRQREEKECCACGSHLSSCAELAEHLRLHKARNVSYNEKAFICITCGQQFIDCDEFSNHVMVHRTDYSCRFCKKSFNAKNHVKIHERIHTGEKPYKCKHCDYGSGDPSNMITHAQSHLFPCGYCEKRFSMKSELKTHELTHTPFECSRCGRRFNRKQLLGGHILLHRGQKSFSCKNCNKKFTQNYRLMNHLENARTL